MCTVKILDNGTVYAKPDNIFGYNAWPSIARNDDGEILVVFSGDRLEHICPFGRVLMMKSRDEGQTWSAPISAVNTPIDDRDAGILNIGNNKMLISTFNNTIEQQQNWKASRANDDIKANLTRGYLPLVSASIESKYLGSLISLSNDGGFSWDEPKKVEITAPHGPNLLRSGAVIYAGAPYPGCKVGEEYPIHIYKSDDAGESFYLLSKVKMCQQKTDSAHSEPHIVELLDGRLVLHIRLDKYIQDGNDNVFETCQSISDDGGKTWTIPVLIGMDGAPPHLLQHSSGRLICVYGRRLQQYGIKVMMSNDRADSWDKGEFVWISTLSEDLGYPASIELENGDILTVFYSRRQDESNCSILWTRWRLS